jgi:ribose 5-phosphate isomerase B
LPVEVLAENALCGVERIARLTYEAAMRIAIASDHAALDLKAELRDWLIEEGHEVADLGPNTADRVDYPDFGYRLANVIADGTAERGIALCGSGIGISMSVNRHPEVRCALVSEPLSAALAREHNDANCLALGARLTGSDMARACVSAFLDTEFGGGRHQRRVDKLSDPHIEDRS